MRAVIDTSSLLALVRYYLPFDKSGKLKNFIEKKFATGELVLLDKVYDEAKYQAKGIIIKELDFINDKSTQTKTNEILPYPKFFNLLENQFCNKIAKKLKGINEAEFEIEKTKYLESADGKLVLYCDKYKDDLLDKPFLVTEETRADNDNKLFKKLPEICSLSDIKSCSLPELFKEHFKINLSDYLH